MSKVKFQERVRSSVLALHSKFPTLSPRLLSTRRTRGAAHLGGKPVLHKASTSQQRKSDPKSVSSTGENFYFHVLCDLRKVLKLELIESFCEAFCLQFRMLRQC